jgi:hypothetical protein
MLCLALVLAACGEEASEPSAPRTVPAPPKAVYQLELLGVTDRIPPEQWLASRQAGRDLPEDDPNVVALRRTLDIAGRRFREFPRMVANRAVQLEEMLQQQKMPEPAPELIVRLSGVVGEERHVESFGAICQHYYNLRMQGLDQQEALEVLRNVDNPGN